MKIKYSVLIVVLTVFFSCSNDDDSFIILAPSSISFVHEDGSEILVDECINPNENYAISIGVSQKGHGSYRSTQISYTVNGLLHNITFNQSGKQLIPIVVQEGENTAQLVENGISNSVFFISQGDFQLVE